MILLSACQAPLPTAIEPASATSPPPLTPTPLPQMPAQGIQQTVAPVPTPGSRLAYTYQRSDGNRFVAGHGAFPSVQIVDVVLAGRPIWVVGGPFDAANLWVATLEDGSVQAFQQAGETVTAVSVQPSRLPAGMPPLLRLAPEGSALVTAPSPAASPLTHPVVLAHSGALAFIESNGDLVIWKEQELARFPVRALPDARLLVDERDRLLLLTDATDSRYVHGVLGDRLEAASITVVETDPEPRIALRIVLREPEVVEGIAPIWIDWDGDGRREIVATVSNARQGAQIRVFGAAGDLMAVGPAIGQGSRWRHQLAVAPFGPAGALELADVLTPHIGGVVEFYQRGVDDLTIVARVPGYSSHVLGARNLDMGVAGDFDGDGRAELLVPNQTRNQLGAIRRTADGARVAWSLPLGGHLQTNLAAIQQSDGAIAVAAGRSDGVLRIWGPTSSP